MPEYRFHLSLPLFLYTLSSNKTLALLFIQNNLNASNGRLIFWNQQILECLDAALSSPELRRHPPDGTADLGPRTQYFARFDPFNPKLVENRADACGTVRKREQV